VKIIFMGADIFAVPSLLKLAEVHEVVIVITRPDKPRGRGRKVSPTPVKEAAIKLSIPVLQPKNLNGSKFREKLEQIDYDIVVAVAYGRLIPPDILKKPDLGCICLHPSLLPEYRGCSPIESAIRDGRNKTGMSVFFIGREFDTGDILYQEEVDIRPDDTGGSLRERLSADSPIVILKAIDAIVTGAARPIPQDDSKSVYAPKICREDARIDWNKSAEDLRNLVRAYNPKPGAFTSFRGKNLKVKWAEVIGENSGEPFGTIIGFRKKEGLIVSCGYDSLLLAIVQPEGKKEMDAWSFVVGYRPEMGEILGR